ncbi:MAG: hypothetical protein WKF62_09715 [Solirubrobacterales bacterium]
MRARGERIGETERLAGAALAAGRIAIGAGIWAAPGLTARVLGMKPFEGEALALARLAATRDLILGAWLGAELRDGGKPLGPAAALTACDAGDTLAFALLALRGGEELGAGARGVAAAGPATALGGWLVGRLRRGTR